MISIDEALQNIGQRVAPLPPVTLPIHEAVGCALAGAVRSDVNVPPFDRSMMDGFAIRAVDAGERLKITAEVHAGGPSPQPVASKTAVRIMTGGHVPAGADAVVMVEQTEEIAENENRYVRVLAPVTPEQNIQRQGELVKCGATIAAEGHVIAAEHLGALIEAGGCEASVIRRPRMAILATGDELVERAAMPGPNQIRNTNGPLLAALCQKEALEATDLGIARDDERVLREKIECGLEADILLLSGGVSAGDRDLVPQALRVCGVECVFHKVRVKPGKPIWFGVSPRGTAVFGLPGNPVSSLVGYQLFVRAAVARMSGQAAPRPVTATLGEPFQHRGDRETLFPSRYDVSDDGRVVVWPVNWRGSADLSALLQANGFVRFAAGERSYAAGEMVSLYPCRATVL